jgi:hypothetical protein
MGLFRDLLKNNSMTPAERKKRAVKWAKENPTEAMREARRGGGGMSRDLANELNKINRANGYDGSRGEY